MKGGLMKATDELKMEHEGIGLMLRIMQALARRYGRGEAISVEQSDPILEFLSVFVDKCHHGKEEQYLFPTLEKAGVIRDGGPIGVLLGEHEQGRRLVAMLKDSIQLYASGDKTAAVNVLHTIDDYVVLLTQHIDNENNILFPMAEGKLDENQDMALFNAFEQLERERIGIGKHEEFHALLDRLRDRYLQ
jgi:hemerythrin-like domain-containing protein